MKNRDEYPHFVARFYDVIYSRIRSGVDTRFYLDVIARSKSKVLEIGVGTGRIFTAALKNGADIYGLDVSKNMIERLQKRLPPEDHSRLWIQDAVTMRLPYKFGLVVAPFRVFAHLITVEDQLDCLNNVWEHLEPGGRFIFDLYVPNLDLLLNGIRNQQDFDGEYEAGKKLRRVVSMSADLINQISHVHMEFIWDEEGREQKAKWAFEMRFFFRHEIEHLVRLSKLKLDTIYGDFDRRALSERSKDFVVVCCKS